MRARIERVMGELAERSFEGIAERDIEACIRVLAALDRRLTPAPSAGT